MKSIPKISGNTVDMVSNDAVAAVAQAIVESHFKGSPPLISQ